MIQSHGAINISTVSSQIYLESVENMVLLCRDNIYISCCYNWAPPSLAAVIFTRSDNCQGVGSAHQTEFISQLFFALYLHLDSNQMTSHCTFDTKLLLFLKMPKPDREGRTTRLTEQTTGHSIFCSP